MNNPRDIVVLVGSLRRDSFNRRLARAIVRLAPPTLRMEIVDIGELPLYNEDWEQALPDTYARFRARILTADAVLFVTPEYNRSVPGALKNALDVGSRPAGSNSWDGKPCAIVSATIGGMGAVCANHHLRQSLVALNMPAMAQPEVYIPHIADALVGDDGVNEHLQPLLEKFVAAFVLWISRNSAA